MFTAIIYPDLAMDLVLKQGHMLFLCNQGCCQFRVTSNPGISDAYPGMNIEFIIRNQTKYF